MMPRMFYLDRPTLGHSGYVYFNRIAFRIRKLTQFEASDDEFDFHNFAKQGSGASTSGRPFAQGRDGS
jgi:hypothetical protein